MKHILIPAGLRPLIFLLSALACVQARAQLGATPAESFHFPDGFEVELLYEVPSKEQGSWVNLCVDLKGRLITSDQYGKLYRVDVSQTPVKVEQLSVDIGMAQGLLHTKDGLYVNVNGNGPSGGGVYRLQDLDGDDQFEKVDHLIPLNPAGEHGPHALVLGPDQRIYMCAGNATDIPSIATKSRVPRNWSEDHLLGRMPDGRGFMKDRLAPGGFILSFLPDGSDVEIFCTGFRNEYDIAFNEQGDLFTYDADMEWDIGTPWYRPTRVNHVISGAEFGWRNGTGKWPEYYADSFGAVANIGPGSPTGICFGTGARFPEKYQRALFIGDWSYGVVYAVHLEPQGSSYTASFEPFLSAAPLPITDLVIHPADGAMYMTIGGRRVQSALYRISYRGIESTAPSVSSNDPESMMWQRVRRKLEELHTEPKIDSLPFILLHLGDMDRGQRFAARIALEHLPVELWRNEVLNGATPQAVITGAVALARRGVPEDQRSIHKALLSLDWNSLSKTEKLELLRAYQLSFTRLGAGSAEARSNIAQKLNDYFPVADDDTQINRELAVVLIYCEAPGIVARAVERMKSASSPDEQIHYAISLRDAKSGWTMETRRDYFQWFSDIAAARGGASFGGFIENIWNAAKANLSEAETQELGELVRSLPPQRDPLVDLAPRSLVKEWKVEDLEDAIEEKKSGYDFERGKQMFAVAQCYKCHRFNGQGGIQGPDITGAGNRFNVHDLLVSILEPSKEISDQYQATQFLTEDGQIVVGRVANLNGNDLSILTNMLDPGNFTNLNRKSIVESRPSPLSMMPNGLLDTLTQDEVLDLIAYLRSGGNRESSWFQP